MTEDGRPVLAADVPLGWSGHRLPPGFRRVGRRSGRAGPGAGRSSSQPVPGRESWTPHGLLAYSKLCTHAGCPVGLYQAKTHQLLCPCHQSTFDVLHGAKPVFGPAAAALPQLPLHIDGDGYIGRDGDFSSPVGPAFWSRS